ncbi:class I SAM-dependent methyltransferase [Streptomyces sp. NPDC059697]|uniref:class I SAM-dependent methyltransferase n=1 Tax=Streptomyces sp. NPDC059697 TaxID=3346912 RepID=UPI0036C791B5
MAAEYDEHWVYGPDYIPWMSGRITKILRLGPTDRIVDIGSGTGLFAREVAKQLQPRHPILCVDPSEAMLGQLGTPPPADLTPIVASAEDIAEGRMRLPYEQLDAMWLKESVHHVADPAYSRCGLVEAGAGYLQVRHLCVHGSHAVYPWEHDGGLRRLDAGRNGSMRAETVGVCAGRRITAGQGVEWGPRWEGPGGNIEVNAGDVADSDSRNGLGDALTSAATGVDPNGSRPLGPTSHTGANDRVFVHALDVLSSQGDDMPASLRDDMAKIMTNHGHEVYVAMSDPSEQRHPDHGPTLDAKQVMEMTKQISRSEHSYGLLHEGMNYAIMDDIHDRSRKPEDTLTLSGYAVGFMEEARYNALKGDQHDYTWDKAWSYHASGALLNFIPVYGDIAQRGADVVTSAWIMDEQQHQADKLTSDNQATCDLRRNQLNSIAQQWYAVNSDWASSPNHPGYSYDDGVYKQIAAAANDGNKLTDGTAGDQ